MDESPLNTSPPRAHALEENRACVTDPERVAREPKEDFGKKSVLQDHLEKVKEGRTAWYLQKVGETPFRGQTNTRTKASLLS